MLRSKFGSVAATVGERLPDAPDVSIRLPEADAVSRGGTLLALAGIVMVAVGGAVRYLTMRRADGPATADSPPATGADAKTGEGVDAGPLVGMAALVAMRLFVEWLGDDDADS